MRNRKPRRATKWIFWCDRCGTIGTNAYLRWKGSHADWLCEACAKLKQENGMIDLHATFEKYNNDYIKFELVEDRLHQRPDLCAFLLLHKLVPEDGRDMVAAAEHDEIYLDTDCKKLAEVATEEDILTLIRCGVRYDGETGYLAMFV